MSCRRIGRTILLLAGVTLALAAAVPADQIVLKDGQTIVTRGAIQLDSRRAVYTDLAGHLVSLRIEEVDVARTTAAPTPATSAAPAPKAAAQATAAPAVSAASAVSAGSAAAARRPPPVLRLTDDDVGHNSDTPAESAAGEPAAAPVVTLYSTTWCGWCRKSRQLMQSLGISFVDKDVESDPRAAAEKARLAPGSGVPVLVRGGEVVRGFSEATIRAWAPAKAAGDIVPRP